MKLEIDRKRSYAAIRPSRCLLKNMSLPLGVFLRRSASGRERQFAAPSIHGTPAVELPNLAMTAGVSSHTARTGCQAI